MVTVCSIFIFILILAVKNEFRSHAIGCVNQFIVQKTPSLMNHIDMFLEVKLIIFIYVNIYLN